MIQSRSPQPNWPALWESRQLSLCELKTGKFGFGRVNNTLVLAGEPRVSPQQIGEFWKSLDDWSSQRNMAVTGYYSETAYLNSSTRWRAIQVGVSRSISLQQFNLRGYAARDWRRARNNGKKNHWQLERLGHREIETQLIRSINQLERDWLKTKGSRRIGFLLGKASRCLDDGSEAWVLKDPAGEWLAMVSFIRNENNQSVYLDHMIRRPHSPKLSLDYLLFCCFEQYKAEGLLNADLGLCPFFGLKPLIGVEGLLWFWSQLIKPFYNWQGLYGFKRKWGPNEHPQFLLVDQKYSLAVQVWALFRTTFPEGLGWIVGFRHWLVSKSQALSN